MKAMLIMDMPSSCSTCQLCVPSQEKHTGQFCWKCTIYPTIMIPKRKVNIRQEYCPLREVPQKIGAKKALKMSRDGCLKDVIDSYNACIDEILGVGAE